MKNIFIPLNNSQHSQYIHTSFICCNIPNENRFMNRYGIFNAEAFYDLYVISKHLLLCSIFNEINVIIYFICVCMCAGVWENAYEISS